MDGTSTYSLSDLAAATNDHDHDMGSSWIWVVILFLFAFTGNGFGGSNNALTQNDLQRAIDLNSIQQGQANIQSEVQRTAYEAMSTTKDASYNNLGEIRDLQAAVSAGFANQQTCCCQTQRAIDGVNYNLASQSAAIQANDTANTQKILDALNANRMADMQNQINALQMQNAMAGVVRYPMASTYTSGSNPFCGCNCGVSG